MASPNELRILELIEDHTARLIPAGREVWENAQRLIERSQPLDDLEVLKAFTSRPRMRRHSKNRHLPQAPQAPQAEQIICLVLARLFI